MDGLDDPTDTVPGDAGTADFEAWYRAAYPRLLDALTVLLREPDEAREVVAEACARCLGRWDGGRRPHDPTAWTFRVALNASHRRRRRRKVERDLVAAHAPPASVALPPPAIELWRAVAELPRRQRDAVVLRYVADLTEAQTAAAMGVAPGTVAATLSAARRALARRLELEEDPR
jgi:RNA polymerase sigma-70 factor (ECF subfamily)